MQSKFTRNKSFKSFGLPHLQAPQKSQDLIYKAKFKKKKRMLQNKLSQLTRF